MNEKFVFRSGKHAGKTIAWVKENFPSYLVWVQENQPNMLKGSEDKPKVEVKAVAVEVTKSMVPNLNFWNEGPDPISIPYLNKIKEEQENNFES
jgi:hypothetical protein